MKTIVPAKENIAKLWGHPKPKADVQYRPMKYLLKTQIEDGMLVHNVVTGQMIALTCEEALQFNNHSGAHVISEMVSGHFLVPIDFDEHQQVFNLREILRKFDSSKKYPITQYVILPTTGCNARCYYCFEQGTKVLTMSKETAIETVDYIDRSCGEGRSVKIVWFGGEPTVAANRIDDISRGLKDRGISYSSSIITNGYLFDEQLADKAKSLWNLHTAQISVDGTEENYNRIKSYVYVGSNPYQRVLKNIGLLLDREVHVSLRMNFDRSNYTDFPKLLEEIIVRYSEEEKSFCALLHTRSLQIIQMSILLGTFVMIAGVHRCKRS